MPTTLVDKAKTVARPMRECAGKTEGRCYIYCIIDCDEPKNFGCQAIDSGSGDVHTVVKGGIAAVVSPSSQEKYAINRQNTLVHQCVMEYLMEQGHTVLPVKFDTIAEEKNGVGPEERIVHQVLAKRFDEISSLLEAMRGRAEMGLKALWRDMSTIFREIVKSDAQIMRLRSKIVRQSSLEPRDQIGRAQFAMRVKLGELVKRALDTKKEQEERALLDAIRNIVVDFRKNKTFGDQMFANLAILVEKSRIEEFDRRLNGLADAIQGRVNLRYVGPLPPSSFIELVIKWEE